jgi:superfamily II DNA/RNA helicase
LTPTTIARAFAGRTGRAGQTGIAHTFFTSADGKHARELIKIMKEANQQVWTRRCENGRV